MTRLVLIKNLRNYSYVAIFMSSLGAFAFFGAPAACAITAAAVMPPFVHHFLPKGMLAETGNMHDSSNPYYWVNSGAMMIFYGGTGRTIQGDLPPGSKWRARYAASNPLDTDGGMHPQNIFRLVTRSAIWRDFQQEAYFKVTKYRASASPNRAPHNGFLFFNRYIDGNNLYYTGIRVDGAAVIKRKKQGVYCTMAYARGVFPGTYHRDHNPNLIPLKKWMGLRSVVQNQPDGSVLVEVFMDTLNNGRWTLVAQAVDDGKICGSSPITVPGYAGIRTDFMDVMFDMHTLTNLPQDI